MRSRHPFIFLFICHLSCRFLEPPDQWTVDESHILPQTSPTCVHAVSRVSSWFGVKLSTCWDLCMRDSHHWCSTLNTGSNQTYSFINPCLEFRHQSCGRAAGCWWDIADSLSTYKYKWIESFFKLMNHPNSQTWSSYVPVILQVRLLQEQPSHHVAHSQQQRVLRQGHPDEQERHRQAEQALQVLWVGPRPTNQTPDWWSAAVLLVSNMSVPVIPVLNMSVFCRRAPWLWPADLMTSQPADEGPGWMDVSMLWDKKPETFDSSH